MSSLDHSSGREARGRTRCRSSATFRPARAADRRLPRSVASGEFRVEEFRVPLVDARVSGPKGVQVAPRELPRQRAIELPVRRRAWRRRRPAYRPCSRTARSNFPGHEEFSFEPPRDPAKMGARGRVGRPVGRRRCRRCEARRRQAADHDRPQRCGHDHAEGSAQAHAPRRSRHRGHVQRSQRRGADRLDPHSGVAERDGARHQGGFVGEQSRAGEVHGAGARHDGQGRSRARASKFAGD